jgi:hypothetical protein
MGSQGSGRWRARDELCRRGSRIENIVTLFWLICISGLAWS